MLRILCNVLACLIAVSISHFAMAQVSRLDVESLQRKIDNAGADWQAEDSGFEVPMYDDGRGATVFGLIETEKDRNQKGGWVPRSRTRLAPRLDWRDHNGKNWLPPVRNQGQCGSCTAFAAIGLIETQMNIAAGEPQMNVDLSEQYLFSKIGSCDSGSMPASAMSSLRYSGVPDEVCHPYVSGRMGADQSSSNACSDKDSRLFALNSYQSVAPYNLKWALQYGPVLTTMTVYEDFKYYKSGVYKHVDGPLLGGHAVLLVGYDDNLQAWIVRNSWSERWGDKGYFMISYNANSGFGLNNFKATVARPKPYTRFVAPAEFSAVKGPTTFSLSEFAYATENISRYRASFYSSQNQMNLNFDTGIQETNVDLSQAKDGLYSVRLDNTAYQAKPSYSQIIVANNKPDVRVVLRPDFDISQPASGKLYFEVLSSFKDVPVTSTDIYFYDANDLIIASSSIPNPGGKAKFSWFTQKVTNGLYTIKAVNRVGKLYSFESESVEFEVAN